MYAGLVGALLMTLAVPLWWDARWYLGKSLTTWVVFVMTGVLGALGHLLLIRLSPGPGHRDRAVDVYAVVAVGRDRLAGVWCGSRIR